jgi:hypothetical protein
MGVVAGPGAGLIMPASGAVVAASIGDSKVVATLAAAVALGPGSLTNGDVITVKDVSGNPLKPVQRTYQIDVENDGSWANSTKIVLGERGPGKSRVVTANTLILVTDAEILADCSTGPKSMTLPLLSAVENGHRVTIKKTDNTQNGLTVAKSGPPAVTVEQFNVIPISYGPTTAWDWGASVTFHADILMQRWLII